MGWNEFCFKFPPRKGGRVAPPLRGGDPLQGDQVIVVVVVVVVVVSIVAAEPRTNFATSRR